MCAEVRAGPGLGFWHFNFFLENNLSFMPVK